MPDEAREVVFPRGVPVTMIREAGEEEPHPRAARSTPGRGRDDVVDASTDAEAGLYSEAGLLGAQAREAQLLREQENLLGPDPDRRPPDERTPAR